MDKLDLKKTRKALFTAPLNRFISIDVPRVSYFMVDGHGDPNTAPAYSWPCKASTRLPTPRSLPARGREKTLS